MIRVLIICLCLMCLGAAPLRADDAVDLALVLAVDTSGSVDGSEYDLQISGIAQAISADDVIAAALSGPHRRIAVSLMTWGDPDEQKFATDWKIIANKSDALAFAATVRQGLPRQGGGTGIGQAIAYGVTLIRNAKFTASRGVVDVSGDGRETWELREPRFRLPQAQMVREAAGITVNGLAILTDVKDLTEYYRTHVIGGPGSFAMQAADYDDFARAIHRKLLLEILPPITMR